MLILNILKSVDLGIEFYFNKLLSLLNRPQASLASLSQILFLLYFAGHFFEFELNNIGFYLQISSGAPSEPVSRTVTFVEGWSPACQLSKTVQCVTIGIPLSCPVALVPLSQSYLVLVAPAWGLIQLEIGAEEVFGRIV